MNRIVRQPGVRPDSRLAGSLSAKPACPLSRYVCQAGTSAEPMSR